MYISIYTWYLLDVWRNVLFTPFSNINTTKSKQSYKKNSKEEYKHGTLYGQEEEWNKITKQKLDEKANKTKRNRGDVLITSLT